MRKLLTMFLFGSMVFALALPTALAQAPANEHNCPASMAIPATVGTGNPPFSPNQNLCLPLLAPVGGSMGPLAFIVQGVEPGDRVDSQGTIYVVSIRGVPGGIDLWRWYQTTDGAPNGDSSLPFKYEGQPDNCGILTNGCANNVGSFINPGVAPGGGDADIAVNAPDPLNFNIPNLAASSLDLVPGVTATHSTTRGDTFTAPNVAAALIPVDDRQWAGCDRRFDCLPYLPRYRDVQYRSTALERRWLHLRQRYRRGHRSPDLPRYRRSACQQQRERSWPASH